MPRSSCKPPLRIDDRAVSEVVGQLMIFLILSVSLVGALVGFSVAKDSATERAIEVQGQSIAQSIAGRIVDAAIFSEKHDPAEGVSYDYNYTIDVGSHIEGRAFTIDVDPDSVTVTVPSLGIEAEGALFGVDEAVGVEVCDTQAMSAGDLILRLMTITSSNLADVPAACSSTDEGDRIIFIQETP